MTGVNEFSSENATGKEASQNINNQIICTDQLYNVTAVRA
jgi:hypothetical protein